MIGLLKSANELPGVKQPTSGSDVLHAQETSKIEGKLDTRSVVSEACKQNCKQQHIALDYHENAESILGKKKFSKETCSSTPAKRFCDLTGAALRKRQRIVSDTLCRHQFQPLFSKCDLVNEYRNRSPSSLYSKGSSRSEILQASLQRPIGTQTRHASKQHKDWSFDKAFYKAFYKCSHCSKENTVVVETRICPLKIQETPSASSESATFSQLLNDNGKQFDVKLQHTRPNVASMVCNTFDAVSNRDLYDKSNFSVKGEQIKVKEEKGCERHNGVYSDSENGLGNHSFRSRNSNHSHVNKSGPENLAILKAFTSNESKGQLNLTAKQLSKPSSEKPHCLKFIPRQYVDISSEDVPPDETKQSFSEVGGMENQAKAGDRSVSTKENFVKELKNIFSRLPLVKEERLKEEGVYKMILMAQAYCDKFESESRNENDRENSPQEDNWKSARLPNRASSAVDQKILDAVSNEYERNVTSFRCVDNSLSCKLAVEPAKTVCTNDILSVDRGKISVMSDKVIENRRKGIISSSVLVSQSNEKESRNVCTREESTTFVNNEAFRNNRIVDCSDITLSSNLKSCKKQRKLAGSSKKRRTVKKSCTHEACLTCMKCDDNTTNTLGTVFSTSSGISSADQTGVTEESAKKHCISVDKAFLTEGIGNTKNGINTESCRFIGQSGEEKEHGKMQNSAATKVSSLDEFIIADGLSNLTERQPTSACVPSLLLSKQQEVASFSLVEAKKFYSELLLSFITERQICLENFCKETIQSFKTCKEKEFAKRTEIILKEKRKEMNLKLECEMTLTMQYFRQELWIRIQKCVCGKVGQFSCCSRCNLVFYCSKMCQVVDYMDHRLVCVENSRGLDVK